MDYKFFRNLIKLRYFEKNSAILLLTLISSLLVILFTIRTPQGLYNDPAEQMKALQQYLAGESPSFNHMVMPDPYDLSRDKASWISAWSPGTQILAYPLMINGVKTGVALRIIAAICLILGSIGWLRWFLLFNLPLWVKISFALALPWMRYVSNALFMYSADILVFASAPWILLATYGFTEVWSQKKYALVRLLFTSILIGFALGFAYILKYSAIFVSLGALVYMGLVAYRLLKVRDRYFYRYILLSFILVIIFFTMPVALLSLINQKFAGYMNLVTLKMGLSLRWEDLLFLLANPALAIANAVSMWRYVLLHPNYGILRGYPWIIGESSIWLGFIGLPGGLLLLWLMLRSYYSDRPRLLALSVFFTSLVAMFCIWIFSYSFGSYQARYLAVGSMAILPLAIQNGVYLYRRQRTRRRLKSVLLGAAIIYMAVPLVYGGISVAAKVMRTPRNYRVGPAQIYNPLIANVNLAGVQERLMQIFTPATDVWYIPEAISALDISGRAIIAFSDFTDAEELRRVKYFSSKPLRVHALMPPYFEENGKDKIIRESFVQADGWSKEYIEGSKYICWTTTLKIPSKK